ncbi:MAG: CDP-glycerol glycerophosphotransferase family protein [Lachnospiraceae bacterium]|nr:CDP-glycerol glycerophosphotransferase family protein [Lachnospiraceae bacterium]
MRNRLIYILKHNKVIQKLYVIIMSFVFKIWGLFLKTDEKLVIFVSFMGKNFNDSPKTIYDYMQNHQEYKEYRCVWAFEHPEDFPHLNAVRIDTPAYFKTALKAKYWITNTNIERGLKFKKKGQIYLNTWHGIALKYIGNDCPGRKDYNFDTVNYLTVSGDYDEKVFKSAFNAKSESYLKCGMPRNEELWLADDAKKQEMRRKLGIPEGKKVILYAPTWRESTDGGKSYAIKPPIHFDEWKKSLGDDYVILFRAHHQTTKVLGIEYDYFVRNASDYPAVNDLMIAADMLITDYSAIAFDFSVLCKPILCYAYDYDSYLAERGTYFNMDEKYPNKSCRTEEELLSRINNMDYDMECNNTKRFRDEFVQYGVGATEKCVSTTFGG